MDKEKRNNYHRDFIEKVREFRGYKHDLTRDEQMLEKTDRLIKSYKTMYKKTDKISEFECAQKVKTLKEAKLIYEKEVKRSKELIALSEDYFFVYQEEFGPQNIDEIQAGKISKMTLEWTRKNPWFTKYDYKKETEFVEYLHYVLVYAEDVVEDTYFYFNEINRRLAEAFPDLPVVDISVDEY